MRGIIRELQGNGSDVTVLDLEAGLEHLKRGTPSSSDTLLVVAEPYYRSIETATRAADLGRELGILRVGIVANKIRDERDESMIGQVFEPRGVPIFGVVPFDQSVVTADRAPAALIDVAPDSSAVRAVASLASALGPEPEASAKG